MFYLTCFARVCKTFTARVLTAATIGYMCSVFGIEEILYFGCYCWAKRRKKRCKVDV